jgi:hypothetical protein
VSMCSKNQIKKKNIENCIGNFQNQCAPEPFQPKCH